jgi:CHRD domain-containing protein/PEP-CTERM motif-containing protein
MRIHYLPVVAILIAAEQLPASIVNFDFVLSGASEIPGNSSSGTGTGLVTIDDVANTMEVQVTFAGLTGTTTASHIHCCGAFGTNLGVATQLPLFTGFPTGVTSGTYDHTFDLTQSSTYNPAFVSAAAPGGGGGTVAGAEASLIAGLKAGTAYLNIHTTAFPGGEIRGYAAPEPGTLGLVGLSLAGLLVAFRRRISA